MLDTQQSVASVVLSHSSCAVVFQRNRIDFCCRGELSLEAACLERGIRVGELVQQVEEAIQERSGDPGPDVRALSTPDLIGHIVTKHHAWLRTALPFLSQLSSKVLRVHGGHDLRLVELDDAVQGLVSILPPHLDLEEQVLFPALLAPTRDGRLIPGELSSMRADHLVVGGLLSRSRAVTDDFRLPAWACNSYRTLFAELEALELDVLRHVHLENHELMPRFG